MLKGLGRTNKKVLPGTDDITCKQSYKRQNKQTNKQTDKKKIDFQNPTALNVLFRLTSSVYGKRTAHVHSARGVMISETLKDLRFANFISLVRIRQK